MAKVRVLSEHLSNKIAAGEVVERPVSVVKELLENAIDAEATRIRIYVEKGGKNLIRVMDDGRGMVKDDALLAIERYATSKLRNDEDLFRIATLGFRGEALPSIASISNFTLITRTKEQDAATKLVLKGGKLMDVREEGAPVGTDIIIEDLFFNTPARKKFLKTEATELSHITDLVNALALAYPQIYFELFHNQRNIKQLVSNNPKDRVLAVLGQTLKDELFAVNYHSNDIKITGYVGSPQIARKTSFGIYTFVNGRFVKNASLFSALRDGYYQRLVKGLFPVGVLYIELPFENVDVNVHPTKTQVRFSEGNKVYLAVKEATAAALGSATGGMANAQVAIHNVDSDPAAPLEKPKFQRPVHTRFINKENLFGQDKTPETVALEKLYESSEDYLAVPEIKDVTHARPAIQPVAPISSTPKPAPIPNLYADTMGQWKILGQFKNSYLVCEHGNELVLVDQHAAHERIAYEKLLRAAVTHKADSQLLLMPEIVELSHRESEALTRFLGEFSQYGLAIEPFGGNAFAVKAIPPFLDSSAIRKLLVDLAEQVILKGTTENPIDDCLKTMACHAVIRANQALKPEEMRLLLKELAACNMPQSCPHGRPTFIGYTQNEVEKLFRRKV